MLLNPVTIHAPTSLAQAIDLHANLDNAKLQAGGTFLLNSLKLLKRKGMKTPDHIISLRKVGELKGIAREGGQLIIKSMTTITELLESPLLTDHLSVLKIVAKNISTNPIRNMATVGGNLTCRYTWTEMPAVMIGLDAQLHFEGTNGEREVLDAEDFFTKAAKTDKIFTHASITIDPGVSVVYRRVKKTPNVDIPLLSLLIKTNFEDGRFTNTKVGINNCVTFAQRDVTLENFLNESVCGENTAADALNHLTESIYDNRSSDYKKHVFRTSIKSAVGELINRHTLYDNTNN